jgi:hypothetical protein
MLIRWLPTPSFAADGDGGAGGSDDGDGDGGTVRASDVLQRYGNTAEAALRLAEKVAELENRNWQLRDKNRVLRQERDALKGQVPAEGSAVLSAADAATLDAYKALGAVDALKAQLTAAEQAAADLAALQRQEAIRAAAEAHGYKAAGLAKLPSLAGKAITLRDVQDGEGTARRAFVDDTPLPDYIQTHDPEFLPALTAEPPKPSGTSYVPQAGGGGSPPGDLAARYLAQQEERRKQQTNPLMRQP